MKRFLAASIALLVTSLCVSAGELNSSIEQEMRRLDALAGNPDLKLAVVAAMAETLQIHRNHLLLLRRESGNSFRHDLRCRIALTGDG